MKFEFHRWDFGRALGRKQFQASFARSHTVNDAWLAEEREKPPFQVGSLHILKSPEIIYGPLDQRSHRSMVEIATAAKGGPEMIIGWMRYIFKSDKKDFVRFLKIFPCIWDFSQYTNAM